jgi:hypothetical protein
MAALVMGNPKWNSATRIYAVLHAIVSARCSRAKYLRAISLVYVGPNRTTFNRQVLRPLASVSIVQW